MRIVIDGHTLNDHFPGIGRYTFHLIEEVARLAPADQFLVPFGANQPNTRFDLSRLSRLPNVTLVESGLSPFSAAYQIAWSRPLTPYSPIDLTHFPYYVRPYISWRRSCVTVFDLIPIRFPQTLPSIFHAYLYRLMVGSAIRASRLVFTTSEASLRDLGSHFDLTSKIAVVTPLAADPRFTPASENRIAELRTRFNLPERFILALGINKPHKNLHTLLAAFARAQTDAQLVLAGFYDPHFPDPRKQASQLDILNRVLFLGAIADDDLPILFSTASAFAFPSYDEGFGLPVLEAMACGTPVICSSARSLAEIASGAACLVDPADTNGWTTAIEQVMGDSTLRARLVEQGLQRAQQFSWDKTARLTLAGYRQLAEL